MIFRQKNLVLLEHVVRLEASVLGDDPLALETSKRGNAISQNVTKKTSPRLESSRRQKNKKKRAYLTILHEFELERFDFFPERHDRVRAFVLIDADAIFDVLRSIRILQRVQRFHEVAIGRRHARNHEGTAVTWIFGGVVVVVERKILLRWNGIWL